MKVLLFLILSTAAALSAGERDPFMFSSNSIYFFEENIKDAPYEQQKVSASKGDLTARIQFPLPCDMAGGVDFTYEGFNLDWNENPYFRQKHFESLGISAALVYFGCEGWMWRGAFRVTGPTNEGSFYRYTQLQAFLWGKWCYNDCWDFHVGLIGRSGLENEQVLPLIGAEYKMSCWTFSAVFPMKMGIEYRLNSLWSLNLLGAYFSERHQVTNVEPSPNAIFRYRNIGAFFDVTYSNEDCHSLTLFVGKGFTSRLEIMDAGGRDIETIKIEAPWFIGTKAQVTF